MPGLPVYHQLPESTQTHVHWVGDAIQPSHPLSSPSPPAPNRSQHQGVFKWVSSLHQVAKVLDLSFSLLLFASLLFTAIVVKLLCGKQKLINVHGFSEKCLKWGSKVLFNSLWFFSFYHECINWYFSYNSRWALKYYEDNKWSCVIPNLEPWGLSSEDWLWDRLNFTEVF